MQSYTAALFTGGPVAHLLDLAIRVQASQGALSLDDEIRRYARLVAASRTADQNCPVRTGAALLDFLGDLLERKALGDVPQEFTEKLSAASEGTDPAEYLHTLAGIVRILDRDLPPEYGELPMNSWEAGLAFPHLARFTAQLTDDLESATVADAVRAYIAAEHPFCSDSLAPWVAEAHRALVLFPDAAAQRENLLPAIPWSSPDALRELLGAVDDHMRREHS
ncbi:hypothetical protein [Streptomyces sp. TLI_146]|uniref:hypothetical protein n=1 Tax=Streptomyces sp. TLI_146 TaxID=1938858 RepID=UPI000CB8980C|nr:hypothetical protein [Streptomyces sp. TLI_146]PKV87331.1 hypothetical protein BX283_4930 [Streptomyces sp. TLI_146]